jgi:hypothetical protein
MPKAMPTFFWLSETARTRAWLLPLYQRARLYFDNLNTVLLDGIDGGSWNKVKCTVLSKAKKAEEGDWRAGTEGSVKPTNPAGEAPRSKEDLWPAMRFPPINLWSAPRLNVPATPGRSSEGVRR